MPKNLPAHFSREVIEMAIKDAQHHEFLEKNKSNVQRGVT